MKTLLLTLVAAVGVSGCRDPNPSAPGDTIPMEVFVDTYVDLRVADLTRQDSPTIDPADRERILDAHGVTSEALLEFVEVHGPNVPFISMVWDSVEARYRRRQNEVLNGPDSMTSQSGL